MSHRIKVKFIRIESSLHAVCCTLFISVSAILYLFDPVQLQFSNLKSTHNRHWSMVDPLDGSLLNRFSSVEVEANFVFMQLIGNESETSEHGQHDGICGTTFYYIHTHSLYHTQHVARCVQQIFVPRMLFFFICTFLNIASTDLRDD